MNSVGYGGIGVAARTHRWDTDFAAPRVNASGSGAVARNQDGDKPRLAVPIRPLSRHSR